MNDLHSVEILLVEDSSADAEMTMRSLKKRGIANRIEWVRDGIEGLQFLFREGKYENRPIGNPRMVLLDLKMPRMDGLEVLKILKNDVRTRSVPGVMMTSSREEGDLLASYELGVNSYVVKPVDFVEFAETVTKIGMYWMLANHTPES